MHAVGDRLLHTHQQSHKGNVRGIRKGFYLNFKTIGLASFLILRDKNFFVVKVSEIKKIFWQFLLVIFKKNFFQLSKLLFE